MGGLRDGLVISWPKRIKALGQIRPQFHHVIDIAPTIYEAVSITAPGQVDGVQQQPIDGVSMVYSFDNAAASSARTEQYFEMLGNRSFYKDGWLASTTPGRAPFDRATDPLDPTAFKWELYNLTVDYSQSKDLSAQNPQKLAELQAGFDAAAKRYNVYPIAADLIGRAGGANRPSLLDGRKQIILYPGDTRYPAGSFPGLMPGWEMTASLTTSSANATGPIVIAGDEAGGAGLFIENGRPVYLYNATARGAERFTLTGAPLAPGNHMVSISVTSTPSAGKRAARIAMLIDGMEVAAKEVPIFYPVRGGGVIGRYGVRTLLADQPNAAANGFAINRVEFTRR